MSMSKKTTSVTLRLYLALTEAAERFRKKYAGHDRHWVLAHWCRIGAIKDGAVLADVPTSVPSSGLEAVGATLARAKPRSTFRLDSDVVLAAGEAEHDARRGDRTRHWWLVHWIEVGATVEGAQLFDVDGKSSRGWGHGFDYGDRVRHCDHGLGALVAVGPDSLTAALDRGGTVNGPVGAFSKVEEVGA
jgi:hypothetical protein